MFASVVSWTIEPLLEDPADREQLIRELVSTTIGAERQAGVVDIVMIEAEPNLVMGVGIYELLEQAYAVGSTEVVDIAHLFANRLQLISRVVGSSYDPPSFSLVDRDETQQWREETPAMFASVASWRIDSTLRSPQALGAFLQEALTEYLPLLRQLGLLDMHVIRLADDVILVIHLFGDWIEGDAAYQHLISATQDILGARVEFIKGHYGRAFDVPQLLGSHA